MVNELGDVWELEALDEKRSSQDLDGIVTCAIAGQQWAKAYLVSLWAEDWEAIKAKLECEGSLWYIWWMHGVRKHLAQSRKRVELKS